jgi:hypothetical protein
MRITLHSKVNQVFSDSIKHYRRTSSMYIFCCYKDPIYLQSVIIRSANGGKGERWHVEEYSVVALLCSMYMKVFL